MPQNEMSLVVDCGVDYGSDLDWVEEVTLDVARDVQEEVDGAVPGWEPTVRWKEFGPSNVNFGVVLRINQYLSKYDVRNAFMKRLHARYRDEGIEISWPIRKIHETS
jgi:small-conductance mechanosensitive channel